MTIPNFNNELITKEKLNVLVNGINTNTEDITDLDGTVATNTSNIATNTSNIATIKLTTDKLSITDTLITFSASDGSPTQKMLVGGSNVSLGLTALLNNLIGHFNVAIGVDSMLYNIGGNYNTAIGIDSLKNNTSGSNNTSIGYATLIANTAGIRNTAIGFSALSASGASWENCSGLGYNSQVTASNQVQLGNSSTTTYVYGTVQNRSDKRDKADIAPTQLGLDFILKLTPVDYKWDMREDYIEYGETEEGRKIKVDLDDIVRDGSKKRSRNHSGFIAQEVKEVIDELGVDFGGYQDHSINGGKDVLSLGYDEFIAPMVKAIQELTTMVKDLQAEVENLKQQPTE